MKIRLVSDTGKLKESWNKQKRRGCPGEFTRYASTLLLFFCHEIIFPLLEQKGHYRKGFQLWMRIILANAVNNLLNNQLVPGAQLNVSIVLGAFACCGFYSVALWRWSSFIWNSGFIVSFLKGLKVIRELILILNEGYKGQKFNKSQIFIRHIK